MRTLRNDRGLLLRTSLPAVVTLFALGACVGNEPQLDPKYTTGGTGGDGTSSSTTSSTGGGSTSSSTSSTGSTGGDGGAGGGANVCPDGVKSATEDCDDGDSDPLDGCDANCDIEPGWDCTGTAPSVCTEHCGDGMIVGDEECDDNNTNSGDGCRADCTDEECGDGIVDANMRCFDAPVNYPGGPKPFVAHLNNDNVLDLVVFGDGLTKVRLGSTTSPGTFGSASASLGASVDVRVADVNNDTFPDIVASDNVNGYAIPGNGTGTFGGPLAAIYLGVTGMLIDLAKLDGDAFPDLAASGCNDGSGCGNGVSGHVIRPNAGNGTWPDPASQVITGRVSTATRLVKIDGDANFDLVTLNFAHGSVGVYLGNGDRTFDAAIESIVPDFNYLNSIDFGLVNNDAFPDLVVGSQGLQKPIYVMFGNGSGNFGGAVALTTNANTFAAQFADVDNDGNLDVLSGTQTQQILFYKGDGAGGFGSKVVLFTPIAGDLHITTGDLNNDGALDVVSTLPGGGIDVYLSNP